MLEIPCCEEDEARMQKEQVDVKRWRRARNIDVALEIPVFLMPWRCLSEKAKRNVTGWLGYCNWLTASKPTPPGWGTATWVCTTQYLARSVTAEIVKCQTNLLNDTPMIHETSEVIVAKMAWDFLAIPPTLAECERTFSSAALTLTYRRSNMSEDTLEACECLRAWFGQKVSGE